ncbi:hypothetical protein BC831DRAFT_510815 [Entophlyctis helioformis]|nr:hypothetical protein BC831DRAFT_510815 [Entophlyctis helioformis]
MSASSARHKRMLEGDPTIDGVEKSFKTLGVRSEGSSERAEARRKARSLKQQPSSFMGAAAGGSYLKDVFNMATAAEAPSHAGATNDDDHETDETFQSSTTNGNTTEDTCTDGDASMEIDAGDDAASSNPFGAPTVALHDPSDHLLFQNDPEAPPPRAYQDVDDGYSDFAESDADPDMPSHDGHSRFPRKFIPKYLERARATMVDLARRHYSNPEFPIKGYWVVELFKFNIQRQDWVSKGPALVYFISFEPTRPQMVVHYLYGSRGVALNLIMFEHFDRYFYVRERVATFSTHGHSVVPHVVTHTEQVPLSHYFPGLPDKDGPLPVYKCTSHVSGMQEQAPTLHRFRFLSQQDQDEILLYLKEATMYAKVIAFNERRKTFESQPVLHRNAAPEPIPPCIPSCYLKDDYASVLAQNGFVFRPFYDSTRDQQCIKQTIQCTWCKASLLPHGDGTFDVVQMHASNAAARETRCPFTC